MAYKFNLTAKVCRPGPSEDLPSMCSSLPPECSWDTMSSNWLDLSLQWNGAIQRFLRWQRLARGKITINDVCHEQLGRAVAWLRLIVAPDQCSPILWDPSLEFTAAYLTKKIPIVNSSTSVLGPFCRMLWASLIQFSCSGFSLLIHKNPTQ